MNWIDILLGVLLAYAAFQGFRNGIFIETASIGALVLGILFAVLFSGWTKDLLVDVLKATYKHIEIIAFIVTFVIVVILVHFVARAADKLFKALALGIFTRLTGMVVGVLKIAFILSVILVIIETAESYTRRVIPSEVKRKSIFYAPVRNFAPNIFPFFKKMKKAAFPAEEIV